MREFRFLIKYDWSIIFIQNQQTEKFESLTQIQRKKTFAWLFVGIPSRWYFRAQSMQLSSIATRKMSRSSIASICFETSNRRRCKKNRNWTNSSSRQQQQRQFFRIKRRISNKKLKARHVYDIIYIYIYLFIIFRGREKSSPHKLRRRRYHSRQKRNKLNIIKQHKFL